MKKLFTLLLAFTAVSFLYADSGKIGPNATWHFSSGVFSISGSGETYDGEYSYNGMYIAVPSRENGQTAEPYGVITFKYGAEKQGDAYTFKPEDVKKIVIGEGITKLGEWTCAFFTNAKSVQLPGSLVRLGGGAFLNNTSLTEVTIPVSVDSMVVATCVSKAHMYGDDIPYGAFHGCTNLKTVYWNARGNTDDKIVQPLEGLENTLTNIVLGSTVVHIPEKICMDFTQLKGELRIEKNIKTVGYAAFAGCKGINKISILADSIDTQPTLFWSDYYYSWLYTNYRGAPFAMCSKNLEIFIAKNVQYIGNFMFSNYMQKGQMKHSNHATYEINKYEYVDSISITFEKGSTLKGIGDYAFAGVKGLSKLTLPSTLEDIMPYAFYDTDIKSIVIPKNIKSIGINAFSNCSKLSTVRYNAQKAAIYTNAVYKDEAWTFTYQSPFINCADKLSIIVGKDVTSIPAYMFMGGNYIEKSKDQWTYTYSITPRTDIKSVTFAEGSKLASIQPYAFAGCSALTDIDFSKTSENLSILSYAFAQAGITKLNIPANVSWLGSYAFDQCLLDSVFYNATSCQTYSWGEYPTWKYASPFSNNKDNTVFIIGEEVTNIPHCIFSKYEYQINTGLDITLLTSPRNHYTIHFNPKNNVRIGKYSFAGNLTWTELKIPSQCWDLGSYAFADCENVTKLQVHDSLSLSFDIYEGIFNGCNNLKQVEWNVRYCRNFENEQEAPFYSAAENIESFQLGKNIENIPNYLCVNMPHIEKMSVPENIYSIGDSAFYGCTAVDTFFIHSMEPPELGENVFPAGAKIIVRCKAQKQYLDHPKWNLLSIRTECIKDYYVVSGRALPAEGGAVEGLGEFAENEQITITALPAEGYHFSCWNDGDTSTIRTVTIEDNITYIALFLENEPTGSNIVTVETGERDATLTTETVLDEDLFGYILKIYDSSFLAQEHHLDKTGKYRYAYAPKVQTSSLDIYVSGLHSNTTYYYTLDAIDISNLILNRKEGFFTTKETYCIVKFFDWDDTILSEQSVAKGADATPPEEPSRAGYEFIGWDKDYTNIQSDLTIYAQYKRVEQSCDIIETRKVPSKILFGDQIFILRGENIYTVTGQQVSRKAYSK